MPPSPKHAFSFVTGVRSNGFVQLETLVPTIEGLSPAPPLNPYPHTFALLLWQAAAHELIIPLPLVAHCQVIAGGMTSKPWPAAIWQLVHRDRPIVRSGA